MGTHLRVEGVILRSNPYAPELRSQLSIQHKCQKEFNDKNQEVHQLKQLHVQYQEQLRTLKAVPIPVNPKPILNNLTGKPMMDPPPAPEPIAQGRILRWGRRCGRGRGHGRERALEAILEAEFEKGDDGVRVPTDDVGPSQATLGFVAASHLQNTLDKMLGVLETIV
ncbi:hypothetical protein BC332_25763 [Capsicum chinense]|nr:hypothetical protein BC332_25763 [Capsicum chinense]